MSFRASFRSSNLLCLQIISTLESFVSDAMPPFPSTTCTGTASSIFALGVSVLSIAFTVSASSLLRPDTPDTFVTNPAYAVSRPCSLASRPTISSSSVTRSPKIALIARNTSVIVIAAQAATDKNPTSWIPSNLNPPP